MCNIEDCEDCEDYCEYDYSPSSYCDCCEVHTCDSCPYVVGDDG